ARRAHPDQADQMAVGAAHRAIAVALHQFGAAFIFALARPAVQHFHRDHILERGLARVMLVEPDIGTPRMARQCDTARARHFVDQLLGVEANIREVEPPQDVRVDAVDQDVAVVGFDLGSAQDHHAEFIFQVAIVSIAIELAMLRQHDTVERALHMPQLDPVEVRLYRCAAVLGGFAMGMQIKDCGHQDYVPYLAGRNFASVTSGVTSSYTTSTGIPILTSSGRHSTRLVSIFKPSSSSIHAMM